MKLSTERILTTHVGSLPRSQAAADMLLKKERGEPYEQAEFDRVICEGVDEIVARQVGMGIDVVSDGETSKISYSTYIKDRLTGFGGEATTKPHLDVKDHPEFRQKMVAFTGPQSFKRTCCIGPIEIRDREAVKIDVANFRAAVDRHKPVDAFLNAASPGVVASFQPNKFYPTHEAYVTRVAEVMQEEYEAITGAGFLLQIDCPDLAMSRHTGFQDLTEEEFLKRAEFQVEALNHALRNIPADALRMHVCWGNYEAPHDHDIELKKILGIVLKAKPRAITFESSNPRHGHEWAVWKAAHIPEDKVLMPGVLDTSTNFVEHPELVSQRIERFAEIVGRERVIASTDCGFGTFAGHYKVHPDIVFKKLASMVEGARIASGRLWG
jgi:5-methyltetrahydropteroyltriglutamate--homocysteine methyltransferase